MKRLLCVPPAVAAGEEVVGYAELARAADRYGRGLQALGLVEACSAR